MARAFPHLQGFFNFVVFMYPKVVHAKDNDQQRRGEGSISWYGAFVKVVSNNNKDQQAGTT